MKKKMKVYISLPISGKEKKARAKADSVKAALSRLGHRPVNPFEIYAGRDPSCEDHILADLTELVKCDAILLCDGWPLSRGCRIEAMVAKELGKKVLYENRLWETL